MSTTQIWILVEFGGAIVISVIGILVVGAAVVSAIRRRIEWRQLSRPEPGERLGRPYITNRYGPSSPDGDGEPVNLGEPIYRD